MKTIRLMAVLSILLVVLSGCGLFDEAGRAVANFGDDTGRVVGGLADETGKALGSIGDDAGRAAGSIGDDVGRIGGSIGDDMARTAQNYSAEFGSIVERQANNFADDFAGTLTSEEEVKVKQVLKSFTCLYLEAGISGRAPTEQEWAKFFIQDLAGFSTIQQQLQSKAQTASDLIESLRNEESIVDLSYNMAVTLYCGS